MSSTHPFLLITIVTTLCFSTYAGQTTISGYTYRWQEARKPASSNSDDYEPLPHVKITVVRYKSLLATDESRDDGSYEINVESGGPINVIFYLSSKDVPEMQNLSATPKDSHHISAALMTVNQHRDLEQRYHLISVGTIVHCILAVVPEDSDVARVVRTVD
jgi:hypothetical protein